VTGSPPGARVLWLDVARIAAILGVITIHVVSGTANAMTVLPDSTAIDIAIVDPVAQGLALVFLSAVTWCVPLFVMISGALLLGRPPDHTPATFYRRRLSRLLPPIVFWSLAFWGWRIWFHGQDVPPDVFARLLLMGRPYAHLYFLFVIVGLYLVTPLVQVFLRDADRRYVRAAVGIALGLAAAQQVLGLIDLSSGSNIVTYFVPFTGYYLAGYYLRDVVLGRRGRWLAVPALVGTVATMVGASIGIGPVFGIEHALLPQGYLSVLTIASTLIVFMLARSWFGPERAPGGSPRWLATSAAATFGVYLAHPMVLDLWRLVADIGSGRFRNLVVFPVSVVVVGIATLALVLVVQRLPIVRRIVP
jgi:surface polysaccharide O-acyltransferase-like enzyme